MIGIVWHGGSPPDRDPIRRRYLAPPPPGRGGSAAEASRTASGPSHPRYGSGSSIGIIIAGSPSTVREKLEHLSTTMRIGNWIALM
ncbi:hypothetical protein ABZ260_38200, partial [Streptosporangium sp. NPDC006013]|uniref:hypothetical protein n=1 Tax=Streptosporangium sp. NPDC006013 TaxID=3155596 RepID=UPI0033AF40DB